MDPRSSNRQKVTTGNSKGVHRRGEGLGTGPVGRKDAYAGKTNGSGTGGSGIGGSGSGSSGGKRAAQVGGGSSMIVVIIVIIVMLLNKGGSGSSNLGSGTTDYSSTSTSGIGSTGATSQTLGNVNSLFGGFAGASTCAGWQNGLNNTSKLNREVSSSAREKYTEILGNGEDTVTMMVYMCGTDLESRSGMASNDLSEMARANIPDNINIIVYTGGCNGWKTQGISNKTNQIYRVRSGKIEQIEADDGDKAMTDPSTLTSFIKRCAADYPANRQFLIFWDHGGGSISGYGYDEKHRNAGSMDLSEINKALADAGQKFDFIGFDACLMATLETAIMTSNYADYLIASEETEPGIGWYYTKWLDELSKNTSMPTLDIGKNIVDGFVDECNRVCRGQKTTLSVIDLAEFSNTVPKKLSAFSTNTKELIKSDNFKQISDARAGTREFATSSKIDQIDLVNFANSIATDDAKDLADTTLEAIKYNRTSSSMTNAYGVSIYFPLKNVRKVDTIASINSSIGMDDEYNQCIKAFAGLETTGQIASGGSGSLLGSMFGESTGNTYSGDALNSLINAFISGGKSIDGFDRSSTAYLDDADVYDVDSATEYISKNQFDTSRLKWVNNGTNHLLDIPKSQWKLIQNLQINMYVDDGSGYVDLGLDNLYTFTQDGKLIGDTDNTWFSINGQPVAFYYEDTIEIDNDETIVQGRVPAYIDGKRCNIIIIFDSEHPSGYIAGARYDYTDEVEEFGTDDKGITSNDLGASNVSDIPVAKGVTEIEDGVYIEFICDYYDYDNNYQETYKLGDPVKYSDDMVLSYEDVGAPSRITYLLTDIYNTEYWTPPIDQK